MKTLNKIILMTSALLLSAGAWADDFGDFGDFGSFDDESANGASSKIEVSGKVSMDSRAYVDKDDSDKKADEKIEVAGNPSGKLELSYSGNNSDMTLSLNMDADMIKSNPEDIIDELVLRGRLGDYVTVEAGKMKIVWGKGDKLHVLDNFNADNYSDFIIPDYLDRRISTPMVRGIISLPVANLNLEGVYTPLLPTDRFAVEGRWTPAQVTALKSSATGSAEKYVKQLVTDCETYRTGLAAATTIAVSSEAQAKAATETAAAYSSKLQEYNNNILQLGQAKAAGLIDDATYQSKLEQLKILIIHCTAEQTAQTEAAEKYSTAAKEAAAQAEDYKAKLAAADTAYTLALNNATSVSDNIYPDLWTLKYGQFGGRATWTFGQVDMGISYYNGWYKQPSVNASKIDNFLASYLTNGTVSEDDKFLAYDKKQTFGLEASSIIWHFNVRGEFAYNLTDDTDGTDPWVHNNSIGWLGGFDIDLPFWNANLNVQEIGTFVMKGDECDNNKANVIYGTDVDYCVNGYTNNKIAANFTASFRNDKIAPEVTVMYGIENKDLVVMPKVSYKPDQNLTLTVSGMFINCGDDNSEFKTWENNSFVSFSAQYQF